MAGKASFNWIDPLLLDQQLTEEERMVRDSAQQFAADCGRECKPAKGRSARGRGKANNASQKSTNNCHCYTSNTRVIRANSTRPTPDGVTT
jgi:hypothetical protein